MMPLMGICDKCGSEILGWDCPTCLRNELNILIQDNDFLNKEIDRFKCGHLTEDEFQNLCHNYTKEDQTRFNLGCIDYQKKLFGRVNNLFQLGDFTLQSGIKSLWKIECDALLREDWETLAVMLVERLPPFRSVEGVPTGGFPLAEALWRYISEGPLLIAEDVVTTGESIERYRSSHNYDPGDTIGCCIFARGPCPEWVTPLFKMPSILSK